MRKKLIIYCVFNHIFALHLIIAFHNMSIYRRLLKMFNTFYIKVLRSLKLLKQFISK